MIFIRSFLFLVIAAWMMWGPLYRQVLGGHSPVFRQWQMYNKKGINYYEVKYYLSREGSLIPIDRHEVLKVPKGRKGPKWFWRIESQEALRRINQGICDSYGGDADVRLFARQATRQGWVPYAQGEKNVCSE
jgi:hypothetical protein